MFRGRRTIINLPKETKEKFEQSKEKFADDPNCSDHEYIEDLLGFVQENAEEED